MSQSSVGQSGAGRQRYSGEVVYLFAYDVAHELDVEGSPTILGQPLERFEAYASRRMPRELFFYRPRMVRLAAEQRMGPHGPVEVRRTVKVFPVGAVSIAYHVPFQVEHIEDLVEYHDVQFDGVSILDEAKRLADDILREIRDACDRPVAQLRDEEAYTVFCIKTPVTGPEGQAMSAEQWLNQRRRRVAAVLTQEHDSAHLSEQEADESTDRFLSYYDHDLAVVDWDAALIVDQPGEWDQTLHIMELANVQLAELEAYDRVLDQAVERSYRDLSHRGLRSRTDVLSELREIRIDLARLTDELSNITKFFGDWHLARIYQHLSARFHLADWYRVIDEKLKTLDSLYLLHRQDQNNRMMMILEVAIVLMFLLDLVILVMQLQQR